MKGCIISNERAGRGRETGRIVESLARDFGYDVYKSTGRDDLPALARGAVDKGYERIVVAGGDGTISRVLNGVAPDFNRISLAVLPFGTGNDLARSLNIPFDEKGMRDYLARDHEPVPMDLFYAQHASSHYCVNAANGGFGGRIAAEVAQEHKTQWGALAYWLTAISGMFEWQAYHAEIELEDEAIDMRIVAIVVANGRFAGGGFPVAPDARLDDGILDVTIIPALPVLELAAEGLSFAMHRHEIHSRIQTRRSRRVTVRSEPTLPFSIDGEVETPMDVTFQIAEHAVRIMPGIAAPALRHTPKQTHA